MKKEEKMGWKNLPYWLKGGVIGIIIPIVFSIFLFIINLLINHMYHKSFQITTYLFLLFIIPFVILQKFIGQIFGCRTVDFFGFSIGGCPSLAFYISEILTIILYIFIWFLIGAIIGGVIGKSKRKSK